MPANAHPNVSLSSPKPAFSSLSAPFSDAEKAERQPEKKQPKKGSVKK